MIAHLNMGYVKLKGLKYLVLDEADRMLDMGFNDDIMKSFLSAQRKTESAFLGNHATEDEGTGKKNSA